MEIQYTSARKGKGNAYNRESHKKNAVIYNIIFVAYTDSRWPISLVLKRYSPFHERLHVSFFSEKTFNLFIFNHTSTTNTRNINKNYIQIREAPSDDYMTRTYIWDRVLGLSYIPYRRTPHTRIQGLQS